jgi:hypothetical protein
MRFDITSVYGIIYFSKKEAGLHSADGFFNNTLDLTAFLSERVRHVTMLKHLLS